MKLKKKIILFLTLILISVSIYNESVTLNTRLEEARSFLRETPLKSRQIAGEILKELKTPDNPDTVFNALLVKAASYISTNENNEALKILKKCGEIKSTYSLEPVDSSYYQYLGTVYAKLSNYGKSLENNIIFLNRSKKEKNDLASGKAYNNIGLVYIYLGNYDKALNNLFETLKIMEKLGNNSSEAKVLNNIGICYTELKNYKQSLEYYFRSLEIKEDMKDIEGIGNAYNNIGQAYLYLNDLKKSLEFTDKAEKIAIELKNKKRMATTFTNMGRIYIKKGEFKRAEKYLLSSLRIKNELNDKWEIAFTLNIIAELYMRTGKTGKALLQAGKGLNISKEIKSDKLTSEILFLISKIHEKRSDYKKSLEFYSKHTTRREKLISEKGRNKIEELKISYEIDKMDNRIKFLEKENDLKNRDIRSRKKIQKLFIALSILLLIIMTMIYFAYKTKLRSNKKLLSLNSTLEERTEKLEKALLEVKTLTGLLPVCSSCKKVRDKKNNWNPMEEYIKEYSEATITHSICPDCKNKIYKEKKP
ncbi:MAG: tetratricopeptide repeat protein [Acidobacteriota bacterium]